MKTSLAHTIASLIPAASAAFWGLRWFYVSTIHRAWRAFKSLNFSDTLTSPGATPFDNCLLTLSAYHALNLFEINFIADWLMLISKGWNLFVRFCGTITGTQLFFAHNRFIFVSFHFDGWKTVGHVPREKRKWKNHGQRKTLNYKPSPIPSGGFEIPLQLTFSGPMEWVRDKMKALVIVILIST